MALASKPVAAASIDGFASIGLAGGQSRWQRPFLGSAWRAGLSTRIFREASPLGHALVGKRVDAWLGLRALPGWGRTGEPQLGMTLSAALGSSNRWPGEVRAPSVLGLILPEIGVYRTAKVTRGYFGFNLPLSHRAGFPDWAEIELTPTWLYVPSGNESIVMLTAGWLMCARC